MLVSITTVHFKELIFLYVRVTIFKYIHGKNIVLEENVEYDL